MDQREMQPVVGGLLHDGRGAGFTGEEPAEGDLEEWQIEMTQNWSLTGGAPEDSFDEWNEGMIKAGNVPDDFDWREHVDFSCLTEVQEKLGLEVEPGNIS